MINAGDNKVVINCRSVYIMVTQNIFLVVSKLHFLYLECRMIYLIFTTDVSQFFKNCSLIAFAWKYVSDQNSLSWSEIPNVHIVDIDDAFYFMELFF